MPPLTWVLEEISRCGYGDCQQQQHCTNEQHHPCCTLPHRTITHTHTLTHALTSRTHAHTHIVSSGSHVALQCKSHTHIARSRLAGGVILDQVAALVVQRVPECAGFRLEVGGGGDGDIL